MLAVTETVSWGVLCYALPVPLVPMREDLGCSTAQLAGGLSLALSTLAGIPVGRWLGRHPPRSMMLAGSVLAPAWLLETVERRERAPKTIVEQIRRKRRELVLPRRLR